MVMSISSVNTAPQNPKSIRQKTIEKGQQGFILGAGIGAIEGFTRKSWLKGDKPSDTFVKQVSKQMEKTLEPNEKSELTKVNKFFEALLDYRSEPDELRQRIEKSNELSNAIIKQEGETTEKALDRIFAQDKPMLKKELRELQDRTVVDKKVNINAAKRLVNKNFNQKTKAFEKANETTKEAFSIIKKAITKTRIKTAVKDTVVGGVLVGIAGMLIGANELTKKQKQK